MSHQTTAVLLFGGFYALWRCARGEWRERGYLVAGACAGATVAAEYTGALGVLALVLYAVLTVLLRREPWRARLVRLGERRGLATLGALPFVLGLMALPPGRLRAPAAERLQVPHRRGLPALAPGRLPGHPLPGPARLRPLLLLAAARALHPRALPAARAAGRCAAAPRGARASEERAPARGFTVAAARRATPTSPRPSPTTPGAGPPARGT